MDGEGVQKNRTKKKTGLNSHVLRENESRECLHEQETKSKNISLLTSKKNNNNGIRLL